MAATYGPLALTANTITSVGIPATSDRVYIGNDSPNDLLVSFAVSQPANVTTSQGDWPYVVQAMHHATLDIPDSYMAATPLGPGGFLGKVWVLPIPRATSLALNGTISSLAQLWVTALDPGDASPDAYAAPRVTDLSSQARVVSIPVAPAACYSGGFSGNPPFTFVPFPSNLAVAPFVSPVWCYLYALSLTLQGTAGWADIVVYVQETGQSGVLATHQIYETRLSGILTAAPAAPIVVTPHVFTPAFPFGIQVNPQAGCNTLNIQFKITQSDSGANAGVYYNIAMDADNRNAANTYPNGGGVNGWNHIYAFSGQF